MISEDEFGNVLIAAMRILGVVLLIFVALYGLASIIGGI